MSQLSLQSLLAPSFPLVTNGCLRSYLPSCDLFKPGPGLFTMIAGRVVRPPSQSMQIRPPSETAVAPSPSP